SQSRVCLPRGNIGVPHLCPSARWRLSPRIDRFRERWDIPAAAEGLHPAGNHGIIETAAKEYVLIAHLQEGSVHVRNGDHVMAGDRIGLFSNSGNTSESYISHPCPDSPDFFAPSVIGLPLRSSGYLATGESVESGTPVRVEFIAP
ncbi:MAG: M23 family metallopeptidase, partial [Chloroflexota bacterium]|nr:M23 family metallopeptidase [Chloroflexota bacterium]